MVKRWPRLLVASRGLNEMDARGPLTSSTISRILFFGLYAWTGDRLQPDTRDCNCLPRGRDDPVRLRQFRRPFCRELEHETADEEEVDVSQLVNTWSHKNSLAVLPRKVRAAYKAVVPVEQSNYSRKLAVLSRDCFRHSQIGPRR
jgi:hypothetical protein